MSLSESTTPHEREGEATHPLDQAALDKAIAKVIRKFQDGDFQDALDRLNARRGNQPVLAWARDFHELARKEDNSSDNNLRQCYKRLLKWIRYLVNHCGQPYYSNLEHSRIWESALVERVTRTRLEQVLAICVPLQRAHALYHQRDAPTAESMLGKPWLAQGHVQMWDGDTNTHETNAIRENPEFAWIQEYKDKDDAWFSMDPWIFRLFFQSPHLGLLEHNPDFVPWVLPARPALSSSSKIDQWLQRYHSNEIQEALERLDTHRGYDDSETWAKSLYTHLRTASLHDPLREIHSCRVLLTNLLMDLLAEWEQQNFAESFERDVLIHKATVERLETLLAMCLPMMRAEVLYRMRPFPNSADYGKLWIAQFHLQDNTAYSRNYPFDQEQWKVHKDPQDGTPLVNKEVNWFSMDDKLCHLLFSDNLRMLERNVDFQKWALPSSVPPDNVKYQIQLDAANHKV